MINLHALLHGGASFAKSDYLSRPVLSDSCDNKND